MIANRRARSLKIHSLEPLDDRITPSGGIPVHPVPSVVPVPVYSPDGSPMDKLGQTLNIIYQEYVAYEKEGAKGAFVSSQSSKVSFQLPAGTTDGSKTEIGVNIQVAKGDFDQALADMAKLGMQVGPTDRAHRIITGYLPISQIPAAANDAELANLTPIFKPPTQVPFRFGH
jgi:hypothetical protein